MGKEETYALVRLPSGEMRKVPINAKAGIVEGKSPIGRPGPVTPWGKPALGYKTRKKHHRTDKFIVKRRNGK